MQNRQKQERLFLLGWQYQLPWLHRLSSDIPLVIGDIDGNGGGVQEKVAA